MCEKIDFPTDETGYYWLTYKEEIMGHDGELTIHVTKLVYIFDIDKIEQTFRMITISESDYFKPYGKLRLIGNLYYKYEFVNCKWYKINAPAE